MDRDRSVAFSSRCSEELLGRALPEGGFAGQPAGQYRPDATAWAVLALSVLETAPEIVAAARVRLVADQQDDGRVPVRPGHPSAAWPTSLAILAWRGSTAHDTARERAVSFLLSTTGKHGPKHPDDVLGHDTSIRGWPWIQDTHSWVEPTSLSILALEAVGRGDHVRVAEATSMLLDRTLPGGGWNYGNTSVFGQALRALPESTGLALDALAGRTERARVAPSIAYLTAQLAGIRTPFTMGWGLLGLGAWGVRPEAAARWTEEILARSAQIGPYDTAHVALLLLGQRARGGMRSVLAMGGRSG